MNIELKNVRINKAMSEETNCFSASIYVEGKRVGEVSNRGCGGPNEYHFADQAMETKLSEYVGSLPPLPAHDGISAIAMDLDILIGDILDRQEHRKHMQRDCRKAIVFRLKTDKPGEWRTLKATREQARDYFNKKYPDMIGIVANDDIDAAVKADLEGLRS